jgi:hypothetical protein
MPPWPDSGVDRDTKQITRESSLSANADDIDRLNAQVNSIMAKIADGSLSGTSNAMKDNPEAIEAVKGGAVVYHRRSRIFMAVLVRGLAHLTLLMFLSGLLIFTSFPPSPSTTRSFP